MTFNVLGSRFSGSRKKELFEKTKPIAGLWPEILSAKL
jgi:hypothetical protein